ncbi:hypothetical protein AALP_AA2G143300 [Arabis alpina]|uniref:GDSL esterase/lipase n=1 Tax=Arabis alpina TaxID=50452 RepID=A0A087HHE4_ARAAL|nr:hypothetical protein AALP_AA2G143300 [Arabis alpina]
MRNHISSGYALILAVTATVILHQPELVTGQARVPAMFVLGDSLVDVGNNNFIASMDRANYLPYGIDLNSSPTGRFSNGVNFVDMIAQLLGISSPPPFADPTTKGNRILGGVNYASAAAGILDESGQNYTLYSLGLRKIFIPGVAPLGCTPNQRASGSAPPGRCLDSVNQILGTFNEGLRSLVDQLNQQSRGAIFVYGNTYDAVGDILNNPASYGFGVVDKACCRIGRNQGQITCMPMQNPCTDRSQYVFWDAFHPTQTANIILVRRAFYGTLSDTYPVNVQQMTLLY